jgi:hypothetical protein
MTPCGPHAVQDGTYMTRTGTAAEAAHDKSFETLRFTLVLNARSPRYCHQSRIAREASTNGHPGTYVYVLGLLIDICHFVQ